MIYMAADNDLEIFLSRNLKQMMKIGSNNYVNIVLHINMIDKKQDKKVSKTVIVEKDKLTILQTSSHLPTIDSGLPETLINFCNFTIKEFPADRYALFLWDHGTGPIDPFRRATYLTSELFSFENQPESNQEDGASCYFKKLVTTKTDRGVCFDDSTGNYLTQSNLVFALNTITTQALNGHKFSLIGFDTCLMGMLEIASDLRYYADYMVASQEVEMGTGWDYSKAFSLLKKSNPTPQEFGTHIVDAYQKTYCTTIDDYTLSCIDLSFVEALETSIHRLAQLMYESRESFSEEMYEYFSLCRHKYCCTHFEEPDYIDLEHFLKNLLQKTNSATSESNKTIETTKAMICQCAKQTLQHLQQAIVANKFGTKYKNVGGLSIYFPERHIHPSYKNNKFATTTAWFSFLQQYTQ